MKKILFLLAMLPMMVFTACSSGGESQNENIVAGIAGVWENNNILVSFDGNGYYAGILDESS